MATSKDFRRRHGRTTRRAKFWRWLGRILLKLLVIGPGLTKLVETALAVIRWLRE